MKPLVPTLATAALALAPSAHAGGGDPRQDWYQLAGDEVALRYARADAFSTPAWRITDVDGVPHYAAGHWTTLDQDGLLPICPDTPFFGQVAPRGGGRGQSAVLVGEDLLLTPMHVYFLAGGQSLAELVAQRAFLFDWAQVAPDVPPVSPVDVTVQVPIDPDDLFFALPGAEVVAHGAMNAAGTGPLSEADDWVLVRLDRPVAPERVPVPLRRSSTPRASDSLLSVGHPSHLPLKLERTSLLAAPGTPDVAATLEAVLHARPGSSGSMVVGERSGLLEGIVVSGAFAYVERPKQACWALPPEPASPVARVPNLVPARAHVPPIGLQVAPGGIVDHHGPPGGPFTNAGDVVYSLECPPASRPLDFEAWSTDPALVCVSLAGGPCADAASPLAGTLAPGESAAVTTGLGPAVDALPPGVHEVEVPFPEATYRTDDFRVHRFRVGVDGFEVAPETDVVGDGPGAHPKDVAVYELENLFPVAQEVRITAGAPWVVLNGGGPSLVTTLPPSVFELATDFLLAVGFDDAGLVPGTYETELVLSSAFPGHSPVPVASRVVRLDVGRLLRSTEKLPVLDGTGVFETELSLDDLHFVADLDVRYALAYAVTGGDSLPLTVDLIGPDGTVVRLDRTVLEPGTNAIERIVDDETSPPTGPPPHLDTFDGGRLLGTWRLRVAIAAVAGTTGAGEMLAFELRATPSPAK